MLPAAFGITGGDYGSSQFLVGSSGNPTVAGEPSIICIMDGYLYYNSAPNVVAFNNNGTTLSTFSCMNLQTGQILWTVPGSITTGQILEWRSQQQKSTIPYLWSIAAGSYKLYSATTGALLDQWVGSNVLSGTVVLEPPHPTVIGQTVAGGEGGGALLVFTVGHNAGQTTSWLTCWNSTTALGAYQMVNMSNVYGTGFSFAGENPQTWTLPACNASLDWRLGIMWNITVPIQLPYPTATWSIFGADTNYVILRSSLSLANITGTSYWTMVAYNVQTRSQAWLDNIQVTGYDQTSAVTSYLENGGYFMVSDQALEEIALYSESTGALLWTATPFKNDFSMERIYYGASAYGMLYDEVFDGYMHAINMTTGVQEWATMSQVGGLEMPEPAYTLCQFAFAVADGKVFDSDAKSYEAEPLYRGHCLYCWDAYTGQQLWNISGLFSSDEISDGILVGFNCYDGRLYAFSRGQTATKVSAPQTEITSGSNVIIQGTVTDQTPTSQAQGTPAISDAWMTPWMQYLYMDQPYPTSATGVPVSIDAVDPNGNYIHIGNATSDISGTYSYQWTPPNIPGKYTITATFSADNSYYGSSGETAAVVVPAATTVTPTATPTSVADMYFAPAIAGIIVAIIIGFVVLALLMLRKRP
jgi:hypothetical protein